MRPIIQRDPASAKAIARVGGAVVLLLLITHHKASGQAEHPPDALPHVTATDPITAGRYLVLITGCNDCHTPAYMEKGNEVPETEWLTGMPIGYRGPWGTTYGSNVRRTVSLLTEDAFVEMMRTRQGLPPHPWHAVNSMSEVDLRAIYRYVQTLKPVGEPAPAYVPPDQEPDPPYFLLDPDLALRAVQARPQE
jgi:mono/diheme cytochrome c family protein